MDDTQERASRVPTEAADPPSIMDTGTMSGSHAVGVRIGIPDQRVRVFVSSTLQEMAPERAVARDPDRTGRQWQDACGLAGGRQSPRRLQGWGCLRAIS